jgi:hypothetical protein
MSNEGSEKLRNWTDYMFQIVSKCVFVHIRNGTPMPQQILPSVNCVIEISTYKSFNVLEKNLNFNIKCDVLVGKSDIIIFPSKYINT